MCISRRQLFTGTLALLAALACAQTNADQPVRKRIPLCKPPKILPVNKAVPLFAAPSKFETWRAGFPDKLMPWAIPADTCLETGYYVGGGGLENCCCAGSRGRSRREGTWGWDYQGVLPRIVALGWSHPRRYLGGTGKYDPDGPRFPHKTPETLFAPK